MSRPPQRTRHSLLKTLRGIGFAAGLATLLTACAPVSRVILLPQEDRPDSKVVVTTRKAEAVIDKPYGVAEVGWSGGLSANTSSAEEVAAEFPKLLALRPPPPEQFVLQFETGTSNLTAESQAQLDTVISSAQRRPGGEILIVGHTDRVGSLEANDRLSLERANAIRDLFLAKGFWPELVEAVGRGEREPVVPTEDEVEEPFNRRAEVFVR